MKTLPIAVLVSCLLFAGVADAQAPSASATGGLRFTIAVIKFENHSKWSGQLPLADTWGSMLTDSLQQSGHFIVIGEADMRQAALQEQDFGASGRVAGGSKTPAVGHMTPAQLLVKGDITNFQTTGGSGGGVSVPTPGFGGIRVGGGGDTAEINAVVYVVDSTTGQVVASKKVLGTASSGGMTVGFHDGYGVGADMSTFKKTNVGTAMEKAIDEAVAFISSKLPALHWEGNIILVKGNQVYINRGSREGVAVGQVFKVGTAEVLRDPATGETLDVTMTEAGTIRVDSVKEKVAICSIVSGKGLQNGMTVMP
jgi:curli biogenesis system outer membrane secretion channel CsgG